MKLLPYIILTTLLLSACTLDHSVSDGKDLSDWIVVDEPTESAEGACPLKVSGEARGNWYFEGDFPISLFSESGELLVGTSARAKGVWMTEDFVPFETSLYYQTDEESGRLVLSRNNVSGLPEHDASKELSIQLNSCDDETYQSYEEALVEEYIRLNIAVISPEEPVLGGTWYVTNVEFAEEQTVTFTYEDGHIEEQNEATFTISPYGQVELTLK